MIFFLLPLLFLTVTYNPVSRVIAGGTANTRPAQAVTAELGINWDDDSVILWDDDTPIFWGD